MSLSKEQVAALERANYKAGLPVAAVTPELTMELRDNVILTASQLFPAPDATHVCLLRAAPEQADTLITEIIDYYMAQDLPVHFYISPACTPNDLDKRLLKRGFVKQETETWMILEDLPHVKIPKPSPKAPVTHLTKADALTFAEIFMTAFDMPLDFAPSMAQLLEPSVGLPGVYHYLGYIDSQPVGTLSLICHNNFGIIGSAAVIPDQRGRKVAFNLMIAAGQQAQQAGVETLVLQTSAGIMLERLLGLYGFKKVFTRTHYAYCEQPDSSC